MIDIEQLKSMKAPFDVVDKKGNRHTIIGFKQNDPLGVGGGIFPDMPVAYFQGGGWLLVSDVLRNYEIDVCKRCKGECVIMTHDGEPVTCPECDGTGKP